MPLLTDAAFNDSYSQDDLQSAPEDVRAAVFGQALSDLPLWSMGRMEEMAQARAGWRSDGRSAQKLNAEAAAAYMENQGLGGQFTLDRDYYDSELEELAKRKREELRRQDVMSRAEGGFLATSGRLGITLAAQFLDPLAVGSAFVPVVGEARYGALLAKAAGATGRAGIRAGVGAAEGAIGAAALEPLIYAAKRQEQADYDLSDSLLNVGIGGAFGGGLHVTGGVISDVLRGSPASRIAARNAEIQRVMDDRAAWWQSRADSVTEASALAPRTDIERVDRPLAVADIESSVQRLYERRRAELQEAAQAKDEPATDDVQHEADETGQHVAKSPAGEITAQENGPFLQVKRADVVAEQRGQGKAVAMMERLAAEAQSRGLTLASDVSVSPSAVRVYEGLERRGFTVTRNAATVNPDTGNLISADPRVPVFEVSARQRLLAETAAELADTELRRLESAWSRAKSAKDRAEILHGDDAPIWQQLDFAEKADQLAAIESRVSDLEARRAIALDGKEKADAAVNAAAASRFSETMLPEAEARAKEFHRELRQIDGELFQLRPLKDQLSGQLKNAPRAIFYRATDAEKRAALRGGMAQITSGAPVEVRPAFDRSPESMKAAAKRLSDPDQRDLADASAVEIADTAIAEGESVELAAIQRESELLDAQIRAITEESELSGDSAMKDAAETVRSEIADIDATARQSIKDARNMAVCAARYS